MSKDKSRLDFIQDTKLCVIGGDYFTVIDADTDGQEYRYEKAETVREAIDNAMAEIGVSQGADSHGWIKCSERLPDTFTGFDLLVRSSPVLVYGKYTSGEKNKIFGAQIFGNKWYSADGECGEITHWQPFPQPPEE